MKALISAVLLTASATAAQAEVKIESRAFHSNLRLDGDETTIDGEYIGQMGKAYLNTAGVGLAATVSSTDLIDLGVGYGFARFYPSHAEQLDLHSISGFTKLNFVKTETGTFYVRAGLTSQDLQQHAQDLTEGNEITKSSSNFTRILNWDAGVGYAMKIGQVDVGVDYKYSETLDSGRFTLKDRTRFYDLQGEKTEWSKVRVRGVTAETQELALTLGVRI